MKSMKTLLFLLAILVPILAQDAHMRFKPRGRQPHLENKMRFSELSSKKTYTGEIGAVNERLPAVIDPISYFVRLQPFVNGDKSTRGFVEIVFEALQISSQLTLHMVDITYDEASFTLQATEDNSTIAFTGHSYDPVTDFYVGNLADVIIAGTEYRLSFDYEGFISEGLDGFYQSTYINEDGEVVQLATTQFQAVHARQAIPCLDEPSFKATFQMEIGREDSHVILTNTQLLSSRPMEGFDGWSWDLFDVSPIMSSYLVAFVISDFVSMSATSSTGTIFRTWSRSEVIENGQYSLDISPGISSFFEGYFDIPYPMPKQDQIAIPDFSAGAMENWGLITYRENLLLLDPVLSTIVDKRNIAQVVSHELAHMWTGNLVTAAWWNDLWLNEGFASYYEYVGTEAVEPDMDILIEFVYQDMQFIFGPDSRENSRPVRIDVLTPTEIDGMFNSNTYSKGACLVRMMENFLTHDTFLQGMKNYLNENAFSNAAQENLFVHLNVQGQLDGTLDPSMHVQIIMDTYTLQPGYPLITVVVNGDGTARLTQERFLSVPNPDAIQYTYWVPISYASDAVNSDFSNTAPSAWMSPNDNQLTITGLSPTSTWHIFNVQQSMYHRVNYDATTWSGIAAHLAANYSSVDIRNRAQLLDDSYILAESGIIPYDVHFSIGEYLINEDHYVPWKTTLFNIAYIEEMFSRTTAYAGLREYLRRGLFPVYDIVGSLDDPSDADRTIFLRDTVVPWACDMGHEPCLTSASQQFTLWMANPSDQSIISPNLKSSVYCSAVKEGSSVEWDFSFNLYQTSDSEEERNLLLFGMACSQDQATLLLYIDMLFNGDFVVASGDVTDAFAYIASTDIGRDLAWNYLVNNFHDIAEFFGSYIVVQELASDASREFNTEKELFELQTFRDLVSAETLVTIIIDAAVTRVQNNMAWMDTNYDIIAGWLANNGYGI